MSESCQAGPADRNRYREQTVALKRALAERRPVLDRAFRELQDYLRGEADTIRREIDAGRSPVPELDYRALRDGRVGDAEREAIRRRGALVVRGVFPREQAERWNAELGDYIESNDYYAKEIDKRGLDQYFSALQSGRPQIFGLYWSRPQVRIRQAESMAETKRFLNRLWRTETNGPDGQPEFDPDNDCAYADRTRRREPGDTTLGLSPHMDAGSVERWLDPAFRRIYAPVFAGDWRAYQPFDGAWRTRTREIPSPAVCSMFRTFQGWTALTEQGPEDGTLQLAPVAHGVAYMLLRALAGDVAEDDLCGAEPCRALGADPRWHPELLETLVSIPTVAPGDTVWWHPDIIHAVAGRHRGSDYANVVYVGASPRCAKNERYLPGQAEAFLSGRSAPDFAAEDYEVDFTGRATVDDLSDLGRAQMGL